MPLRQPDPVNFRGLLGTFMTVGKAMPALAGPTPASRGAPTGLGDIQILPHVGMPLWTVGLSSLVGTVPGAISPAVILGMGHRF